MSVLAHSDKLTSLRPHLGLVCITASNEIRFRTITRSRYLNLPETERRAVLLNLYADNVSRLHKALTFCEEQGIHLYRISSALFPMSDLAGDETGGQILTEELQSELARFGQRATELGIRIVMHPDQFVVLSSDSPQIVATSMYVLEQHARTLDLMELPQTSWTAMCIHGGKGERSDKMIESLSRLPENVRSRIALENDEHAYGADEILDICQRAGVPMIFDVHHHVCHEKLATLEDPGIRPLVEAARKTWSYPEWQLVHLSNGRDAFADPAHHDYITTVPSAYLDVPWVEIEAKAKERAIEELRKIWPETA